MPDHDEIRAQTAYAAYGEHQGWRNFRGDPMPIWPDLPDDIRGAWRAAALAAAEYTP